MSLAAGNAEGIPVVTVTPIIRVYPVRVAYAAGRNATHFVVVNMWGMCRTTGAPPALPAVNDILPLSGKISFQFSVVRGVGRVATGNTQAVACVAVISPTGDIP